MRVTEAGWLSPLLVAMACGGSEFSEDKPDASSTGAAGNAGSSTASASSSTTTAGGAAGIGSSVASGGAGTGMGGGAGIRDAGLDARGGGGAGGAPMNSGDCLNAAECGGDACVELYPGGYRVCATKIPEATMCSVPPGQCCKTSDCARDARPSRCILGPVDPICGGPAPPPPTNVCATDACASAADCTGPNAICAPAGALGRKAARCLTGGCRFDRDCTASAGGACVPTATGCCNQPAGLYCLYPGGCRSNADCKPGEQCMTDGTRSLCGMGVPCLAAP